MSVNLTIKAWQCDLPTGPKLVLLALCNLASEENECWPTVGSLSFKCGTAERTTQGHLSYLENAGLIARSTRPGEVTHYTIILPRGGL